MINTDPKALFSPSIIKMLGQEVKVVGKIFELIFVVPIADPFFSEFIFLTSFNILLIQFICYDITTSI